MSKLYGAFPQILQIRTAKVEDFRQAKRFIVPPHIPPPQIATDCHILIFPIALSTTYSIKELKILDQFKLY